MNQQSGCRETAPAAACRKGLFDKLLQVFLNLKSSEKLMIENERHPSWVSFVTIFLPAVMIELPQTDNLNFAGGRKDRRCGMLMDTGSKHR